MTNSQEKYLKPEDILELYNKYLKEILAFTYSYVRNQEDAEDIAQDIFYKLYEDVQKRQIKNINPRAYLYKTARNHCIDVLRKKNIKLSSIETDSIDHVKHNSSEDELIDSILIDSIYEYIENNLSEKEANVFKLKYYYRLNLDEISIVVDSSISTISRMLSKITNDLEKKFPDILTLRDY